jgi:hypothetical protein
MANFFQLKKISGGDYSSTDLSLTDFSLTDNSSTVKLIDSSTAVKSLGKGWKGLQRKKVGHISRWVDIRRCLNQANKGHRKVWEGSAKARKGQNQANKGLRKLSNIVTTRLRKGREVSEKASLGSHR